MNAVAVGASAAPRWDPYVLHRDQDLADHWQSRFDDGARVALLMGVGFDPRMCMVLELFNEQAASDAVTLHTVRFDEPGDEHARSMADQNERVFASLLGDRAPHELSIARGGIDPTARSAAETVTSLDVFGDATDIVVDVNALPRSMFFPLVAKLLYLCDAKGQDAANLHMVAGDAAWLDAQMRVEGVDEHATWLYPFGGSFNVEATNLVPRLWMPILGENTDQQLERISALVRPDEVCPLLPFPSKDPRRGDRLHETYRAVLFDQLRSDSGTVVYADESNPFQVYRRLRESTQWYNTTLAPLQGCKTAYSALSSKIVAIGALLVAYELMHGALEVGIADIGGQHHVLEQEISIEAAAEATDLVGLTLSGDSYR